MTQFHQLLSVAEQPIPDHYSVTIMADILGDGTSHEVVYGITPGDQEGIAPEVRAAVVEWINYGHPVAPYSPPTVEQTRALMPKLTRRQLMLALATIGVMEEAVASTITDTVDLIEWKNASTFERLNPLLNEVADNLGLPQEQVDGLWNWALQL
ncbi:hypothetical protein [Neorhizobium sp. S3-V5DH]|uniref:hypothetical protein n=1 Tax=Neorhizobium sp. S3-V5DH TaxID=2485166 RepID=UPI001053B87D|nr:hypothetical protein [Neorhizobium sp. S3-V5DH]TCV62300.1 hypothetical protein EDE09_12464 [Neorhizobium sp. S3-V5DH]